MKNLRQDAVDIWNAGVDAVRAEGLVHREVTVDGDRLIIGEQQWKRSDFDRVLVVGAGKAGAAMTRGLLTSLGDWLPISGWVNVPEGTEVPNIIDGKPLLGNVNLHPARPAGINEPTPQGVIGSEQIIQKVSNAGQRDLCIALISGGGSALLPAPHPEISLADKLEVTKFLSGAGADITELNTVRKHLSRIKGGGLLMACQAAELMTLVLSDVLGDPLDLIASGPTVIDSSTPAQALEVLERYDFKNCLPESVYRALRCEISGANREPKVQAPASDVCRHNTRVIGNNAVAVDEAGILAERRGYNHVMHSARQCEGAAEEVGRRLAEMALQMLRAEPVKHRNDCLITGGEPIVKLAPEVIRGLGGRNQQLILSAYQTLLASGLSEREWQGLCLLSGGTDGEDGPTDAAGAILDDEVHQNARRQKLNPDGYLQRNDAYHFFEQTGGLLKTGPTGTNVCDVRVAVVNPIT
ncbi:MAG TPA: glycerate kinase [Rhodopirellula sp.]|nr:MAG: glycerate kinase [Saprospirales bacterium TMED214]HBV63116.1 glycerate kinase [Rhodopirellula sp.]